MVASSQGEPGRSLDPAELRKVRKRKVFEEIVQQIQDLIAEGKLAPGDQLPSERDLADAFAVSRHSLREAIRTLEQQGVLSSKRGSGTYVAVGDGEAAMRYLAAAISRQRGQLAEIFQLRRLLEPQIAWLAARTALPEDIENCERLIARQRAGGAESAVAVELDRAFHQMIARATRNEILIRTVEHVIDILSESRASVYQSPERFRRSVAGHDRIVAALREGDPAAAWKAMDDHLAAIEATVLGSAQPPIAPPAV